MDSITLANYRCFRERQKARLAPLTIVVGENSTGKTSLLALIRALWDVAYGNRVPDFKERPYDLGSFGEIVNRGNRTADESESFLAGFDALADTDEAERAVDPHYFETTFKKLGTRPVPIRRLYCRGGDSFEEVYDDNHVDQIRITTGRGSWQRELVRPSRFLPARGSLELEDYLVPPFFYLHPALTHERQDERSLKPVADAPSFGEYDLEAVQNVLYPYETPFRGRPFASAPVRSKPNRTYDPSRPTLDPEGDYVPMYLANIHTQDRDGWESLVGRVERFGVDAGLFDKIIIRKLGNREGGPFQIEVRHPGATTNGMMHNLIDVGYGVSQVLPVVTELLREDAPEQMLLQQPEVHLHPSAQAALGSLFCRVAGPDRQLIVETHSDYILDRIRMDVRDEVSSLKPDDVSLLFLERVDTGVRIHSLRFDDLGNLIGRPAGYRSFFARETRRSLGV